MKFKVVSLIFCALFALSLFGCSKASPYAKLTDVVDTDGKGNFTCFYGEVERSFSVYLPENLKKDAPLVVMLHYYGGDAKGFMASAGMKAVADEYGFALVFPQGLADPTGGSNSACWNAWLGEGGNDDLGFIVSLANYMQKTYKLSKTNTFAAGFSNGGGMTQLLAVKAPDTFKAIACVSASMNKGIWEQKTDTPVSVLQINGTNDGVVLTGANDSDSTNVYDVVNYWKTTDAVDIQATREFGTKAVAQCYSSESNNRHVWYVEINNGSHVWPMENNSGFFGSELAGEFFNLCID